MNRSAGLHWSLVYCEPALHFQQVWSKSIIRYAHEGTIHFKGTSTRPPKSPKAGHFSTKEMSMPSVSKLPRLYTYTGRIWQLMYWK